MNGCIVRRWRPGKPAKSAKSPGKRATRCAPGRPALAPRRTSGPFSGIISKNLFTFPDKSCIVVLEQSRKPRVKCCQDGELCGRRRTAVRDGVSAPAAPYWTYPPLCSNDTRWSEGVPGICRFFPRVVFLLPFRLCRRGFFVGSLRPAGPAAPSPAKRPAVALLRPSR